MLNPRMFNPRTTAGIIGNHTARPAPVARTIMAIIAATIPRCIGPIGLAGTAMDGRGIMGQGSMVTALNGRRP
jgi:hypothetical protein